MRNKKMQGKTTKEETKASAGFRIRCFLEKKMKWFLALLALSFIIYGSYTLSQYVAGTQVEKQEAEVIIDPGHGGHDPGKIGVNKAQEKDINLKIALKVKDYLEKEGITVLLTRETDQGLESASAANKKIEDMKARVEMINSVKPKIVVSIHQNSYSDEAVKGAQVFYYSHSEEGEEMAKVMQEAVRELDPDNHREVKANDTYYILKRTEVPTIIVECGFLSNWEEAEKLVDEEYQEQTAEAVTKGIMSCIGKEKSEEN